VAAGDGFHEAASLKDACARCASGRLHGPDMVFAVFASSESVHPYIAWFQCAAHVVLKGSHLPALSLCPLGFPVTPSRLPQHHNTSPQG
jgi:hypothetical protein